MHRNPQQISQPFKSPFKQHGAALIFMAFILGLGIAALAIKAFNADSLRHEQDQKTMQTLGEAKKALIAWAVNHPVTPGLMPYPDRKEIVNPIYDGLSDCPGGVTLPSHLIGRLPWKGGDYNDCNNLLTGLGREFRDSSNEPLWYAVSENLVHIYSPSGDPVINPSIIDNPPYGSWLEVYDSRGQLISNRVAAIIIAPGPPLDDQDRSGGIADATNYLDRFDLQAGGGTKSNRTYAAPDEDFYIGEDSRNVRSDNTTYQHPYYFNDKLVYITIDELMAALEKKVGEEVRSTLKTYRDTNGYYPYATQLGTTLNFSAEPNLLSGFLPVDYQSCSYSAFTILFFGFTSLPCDQPIFDSASGITQVQFTRAGGSPFTSSTLPNCKYTSNTCACTGAGSCSNANLFVTCSATSCSSNSTDGSTGTYRITGGKFSNRNGGCSQTSLSSKDPITGCHTIASGNAVITCSTNGNFSTSTDIRFDTALPLWFKANNWQEYVYYHITRPVAATMTVGSKSAEAVVAMTGRPINSAPFASKGSAQTRPSCNALNNYLDSAENADGDTVYDATWTQRSASYNDQNFVVAP